MRLLLIGLLLLAQGLFLASPGRANILQTSWSNGPNTNNGTNNWAAYGNGNQWGEPNNPGAAPGVYGANNSNYALFQQSGNAGPIVNLDTNAFNFFYGVIFNGSKLFLAPTALPSAAPMGAPSPLGNVNVGSLNGAGGFFIENGFSGSNITENIAVPVSLVTNTTYLLGNFANASLNDTLKISGNITPSTTATLDAFGLSNGIISGNIPRGHGNVQP